MSGPEWLGLPAGHLISLQRKMSRHNSSHTGHSQRKQPGKRVWVAEDSEEEEDARRKRMFAWLGYDSADLNWEEEEEMFGETLSCFFLSIYIIGHVID